MENPGERKLILDLLTGKERLRVVFYLRVEGAKSATISVKNSVKNKLLELSIGGKPNWSETEKEHKNTKDSKNYMELGSLPNPHAIPKSVFSITDRALESMENGLSISNLALSGVKEVIKSFQKSKRNKTKLKVKLRRRISGTIRINKNGGNKKIFRTVSLSLQ
jgi:hypothetical protein